MTLVSFAPTGPVAAMAWPSVQLDQSEIAIGRNPASGLCLLHRQIRFNHAVLRTEGAGLYLVAAEGAFLGTAADPQQSARLAHAGDTTQIGPFILTVREVTGDGNVTLSVTQTNDMEPDEGALAQIYLRVFNVALPNVRLWALLLSCGLVVIFFAWPLLSMQAAKHDNGDMQRGGPSFSEPSFFPPPWGAASLWNVGAISRAHSGFAANCSFCHQTPFVPVRSSACLACHRDIGQHADPSVAPAADLRLQRCEHCHHEHKGQTIATRDSQADCVACHGDIRRIAPETSLHDVLDFGTNHPQFRPALVLDAGLRTTKRFDIGDLQAEDHSNVRFTHAGHLKLPKLNRAGRQDVCGGCHVPAPGGVTFKPVQFDDACASCHSLQFEPQHPEWRLPHGHPEEVASRIAGYYARAALAGEVFDRPNTEPFYKPGVPPPPPPPTGTDLVTYKTEAAMMSTIARSTCGECHVTIPPAAGQPNDAWRIAPVFVPDRYMPSSLFRHASHATSTCQNCHAAATSNLGAISLLPGIGTCRACHAGEAAPASRISSSCASCHRFHDDSLMHLAPADTATFTGGRAPPSMPAKELQ